jgi:hypothetical protein
MKFAAPARFAGEDAGPRAKGPSMERTTSRPKPLRNSGEALRRFRSPGLFDVHEMLVLALRHKLTAGIIALMGVLGVVGWWITFWPSP